MSALSRPTAAVCLSFNVNEEWQVSGSSVPNDSSAINNEGEYSHTEGKASVLLPSISYSKLICQCTYKSKLQTYGNS